MQVGYITKMWDIATMVSAELPLKAAATADIPKGTIVFLDGTGYATAAPATGNAIWGVVVDDITTGATVGHIMYAGNVYVNGLKKVNTSLTMIKALGYVGNLVPINEEIR